MVASNLKIFVVLVFWRLHCFVLLNFPQKYCSWRFICSFYIEFATRNRLSRHGPWGFKNFESVAVQVGIPNEHSLGSVPVYEPKDNPGAEADSRKARVHSRQLLFWISEQHLTLTTQRCFLFSMLFSPSLSP